MIKGVKNVNAPTTLIRTAASILAEIKRETGDRTRAQYVSRQGACECGKPIFAGGKCKTEYQQEYRRRVKDAAR